MSQNQQDERKWETIQPYDTDYFASQPTAFTKFMRTFLPWQIFRFIVLNIRMTIMLLKSHSARK